MVGMSNLGVQDNDDLPSPVIRCHQACPSRTMAQGRPICRLQWRTVPQKTLSMFQIANPPKKTARPSRCQCHVGWRAEDFA